MDQWLGHMLGNVQRWGDYRGAVGITRLSLFVERQIGSGSEAREEERLQCVWARGRRRLLDVQMW